MQHHGKGERHEGQSHVDGVQKFGTSKDMRAEKKRDVQCQSVERRILL
jgi:hypothetical protein